LVMPNNKEQIFDVIKSSQIVSEAPYHPGYEDAALGPIAFDEDKDYKESYLGDAYSL
jgi:hypothetical protein